jgi:hypothetical protein
MLIVTALVFFVIGWGNLSVGRRHPERANARISRGLGYVGIAIGLIMLIVGIAMILNGSIIPAPT